MNGIFSGLDTDAFNLIKKFQITSHYSKGQAVFLQDQPAFGVYCINRGKIKLLKSDDRGNDSILRLIHPGDILGLTSMLPEKQHYASAIALEDCTICFFDKKSLDAIMSQFPLVSLNAIKMLSTFLKSAELNCAAKSQRNVREKLAALLISLKETNGVKVGEHWKLDIKLTREEIAAITGSTIETISRLISEFKNDGIIDERDKILFISNLATLQTYYRE